MKKFVLTGISLSNDKNHLDLTFEEHHNDGMITVRKLKNVGNPFNNVFNIYNSVNGKGGWVEFNYEYEDVDFEKEE